MRSIRPATLAGSLALAAVLIVPTAQAAVAAEGYDRHETQKSIGLGILGWVDEFIPEDSNEPPIDLDAGVGNSNGLIDLDDGEGNSDGLIDLDVGLGDS